MRQNKGKGKKYALPYVYLEILSTIVIAFWSGIILAAYDKQSANTILIAADYKVNLIYKLETHHTLF